MNNRKLIVILGPTATGKTKLAVKLASRFCGEIISADSRQVYRGMDIGTGKDLEEYGLKWLPGAQKGHSGKASRSPRKPSGVPYHLIDIIDPKTPFNVAKYQKLAYKAIADVQNRGKLPFLVGGTGLYIDAVIKGFSLNAIPAKAGIRDIRKKLDNLSLPQLLVRLKKIDPETFLKIDQKNRRRIQRALEVYYQTGKKKSEADMHAKPDFDILVLGIAMPMEKIYKRIDSRMASWFDEGLIAEVKKLRKKGVSWKRLDGFGLEYRYVSLYLRGLLRYDEMLYQLRNAIHHFAKRQMTWFKRNDEIRWINNIADARKLVKGFINEKAA